MSPLFLCSPVKVKMRLKVVKMCLKQGQALKSQTESNPALAPSMLL